MVLAATDSTTATILVIWGISALLGMIIGANKGRAGTGLVLGLLLGFIGVIIVAVMSPTPEAQAERNQQVAIHTGALIGGRKCPFCAETVRAEAIVCRFCGRDLEAVAPREVSELELDAVRAQYPSWYDQAARIMAELPHPPEHPADWLREACKRLRAGASPSRVASRLPLSWG